MLPSLLSANQALTVELHEGPSVELIERLLDHRVDLAFVRPPVANDELSDQWLLDEELVAVLPEAHHLARKQHLHLADLAADRFVLPPQTVSARARSLFLKACQEHGGFRPTNVQEATSTASILALVAVGAGVTVLPRRSFAYYKTSGLRSCRLIDDIPPLPLHLAWRTNDDNAALTAVRTAVLQQVGRRR